MKKITLNIKPNNIMTWYSYKNKGRSGNYVTLSQWRLTTGHKDVKRKTLLKYLESFYGKIGEEPREVHKKINNKVIVITCNGKIKQFRVLANSTFNFIKEKNPFTDRLEPSYIDNQDSSILQYNFEDEEFDRLQLLKDLFPKKSRDVIAKISDSHDIDGNYEYLEFERNPFLKKQPKINEEKIKNIIKKINKTAKMGEKVWLDTASKYCKYRYDIAYYLADGEYHKVSPSMGYLFCIEKMIKGGFTW